MKTILKYILLFTLFILMCLALMIWRSPYGKAEDGSQKIIIETIMIDVNTEIVYNYLANSNNAKDWSIYVDYITPLNSDIYKDGEKGSIRRCFKTENEIEMYWDEEILINEKNKLRQLSIYNMTNFKISSNHLLTEQIYNPRDGKCELSLTLFLDKNKANFLEEIKLYYAAYQISTIFKGNLNQIKNEVINLR